MRGRVEAMLGMGEGARSMRGLGLDTQGKQCSMLIYSERSYQFSMLVEFAQWCGQSKQFQRLRALELRMHCRPASLASRGVSRRPAHYLGGEHWWKWGLAFRGVDRVAGLAKLEVPPVLNLREWSKKSYAENAKNDP